MTNPINLNGIASLSFVIPVYNEEATIETLHERISAVMEQSLSQLSFKVYYIDDGSSDDSWNKIHSLCKSDPEHTTGIRFRRNFGKAEALQTGFTHATGDVIFTLDADLQDDPNEIPQFLNKLSEGFDLVSGWKQIRHDPITKTLPSKIFNALARAASGVQLHDFNCGFKAYRSEVTKDIKLFGELHRFIPILAHAEGYKIGEISVQHHPREFGVSKYGGKRFLKGLLDLITVTVTSRYLRRPAHLFGGTGFFSASIGLFILLWLSLGKLIYGHEIGGRPLFFLGILLVLLGAQLVSLGLIAEMITRQNQNDNSRHIAEIESI